MRGSVRLHERLIISQAGFDSRPRNQGMANLNSAEQKLLLMSLKDGNDLQQSRSLVGELFNSERLQVWHNEVSPDSDSQKFLNFGFSLKNGGVYFQSQIRSADGIIDRVVVCDYSGHTGF